MADTLKLKARRKQARAQRVPLLDGYSAKSDAAHSNWRNLKGKAP